jgi:hypothetical protein
MTSPFDQLPKTTTSLPAFSSEMQDPARGRPEEAIALIDLSKVRRQIPLALLHRAPPRGDRRLDHVDFPVPNHVARRPILGEQAIGRLQPLFSEETGGDGGNQRRIETRMAGHQNANLHVMDSTCQGSATAPRNPASEDGYALTSSEDKAYDQLCHTLVLQSTADRDR